MDDQNNPSDLERVLDSLETTLTGIPAPVRKNFFKAFGQLSSAVVDIPLAWLEGKAQEIRATTQARVKIISAEGEKLSEKMQAPDTYANRASEKFAAKIIKEQINLDDIVSNAAKNLAQEANNSKKEDANTARNPSELSDDWLNEFEDIAKLKSSEDMKIAFGRILSGEIKNPGTFSIRTIKIMSQLDNVAAKLFQNLCSLSISMRLGDYYQDARVVTLTGNASSNGLSGFGLNFAQLNILQEYGLIISDFNSYMDYTISVARNNKVAAPITYLGKDYGLVPIEGKIPNSGLKIHGVGFTNSGKELLKIITCIERTQYTNGLISFFQAKGYNLVAISG